MNKNLSGDYIRTRSGGKLFRMERLRVERKIQEILIKELLHADVPDG